MIRKGDLCQRQEGSDEHRIDLAVSEGVGVASAQGISESATRALELAEQRLAEAAAELQRRSVVLQDVSAERDTALAKVGRVYPSCGRWHLIDVRSRRLFCACVEVPCRFTLPRWHPLH